MNNVLKQIKPDIHQLENTEFQLADSLSHKIDRILKQEAFKKGHFKAYDSLTSREVEIISLVASGLLNPQIAEKLCISRYTVEQHRKNINRKLNIKSIKDLFQYALAFDLI